jgi:hypothetical protein
MTAYIADHRKKKAILEKRIEGLRHALKNGLSEVKIKKEIEKVRSAKLAVFKMEFSRDSVLPAHDYEPTKEAIEWKHKSQAEILNELGLQKT